MNKRIRKIRESLELSQQEFANRINLKGNSIYLIEAGKRNPSDRTIKDICAVFNVNESWLRSGIGNMFLVKISEKLQTVIDLYDSFSPELQDFVVDQMRRLNELKNSL
jgi:transcriptional regulator with XRE-family HTH domain